MTYIACWWLTGLVCLFFLILTRGWGSSSVGRELAQHAHRLQFEPLQHINDAW